MRMKIRARARVNSRENWFFMKPKLKCFKEGKFKIEG